MGKAEATGRRRHVDDAAAAGRAQQRHCPPNAQKMAVDVDFHRVAPVVRRKRFHRSGRSRNAGVVDQHVEPAQRVDHVVEEIVDVVLVRNVAFERLVAWQLGAETGQGRLVDVADGDARADARERARDFAADAGSAGSHEHAQIATRLFGHRQPPKLMEWTKGIA